MCSLDNSSDPLPSLSIASSTVLQYQYVTTANSGKITTLHNFSTGEIVEYQYDSLNRLIQASTVVNQNVQAWGQQFSYDGSLLVPVAVRYRAYKRVSINRRFLEN